MLDYLENTSSSFFVNDYVQLTDFVDQPIFGRRTSFGSLGLL